MKLFEAISRVFGGGKGGEESEDEETRLERSEQGAVSQVDDTTQPLDSTGHVSQSRVSGTLAESSEVSSPSTAEPLPRRTDQQTLPDGGDRPEASGPTASLGATGETLDLTDAGAPQEDREREARQRIAEDTVAEVWNVGDVILDLYEVKGILGEGGFGTVYNVHHRDWNVDLAVKSPRPDRFRTEREKQQFVEECQIWIDLGLHPHVVSCHYVRLLGGIPRVFAEYVEGGTLKDWIADGRVGNLETLLDIAIQVAWGVAYAHGRPQPLVHRDLKPANVLVTSEGIAKVTDFGLARHGPSVAETSDSVEGRPCTGVMVSTGSGTPGYGAPEQWSAGEVIDHRVDVFSFGVILWRMLGGRITWADEARKSTIAQRAVSAMLKQGEPGPVPEPLAEFILRCLEPEPEERWSDSAALVDHLRRIYHQCIGQDYQRPEPKLGELLADSLNNQAASLLDLRPSDTTTKQAQKRAEDLETAAEQLWQQALQADPHHLQTVYNMGLAHWRQGRITDDTLLTVLGEAGSTSADQELTRYVQALVHRERGDCASIIELLQGGEQPENASRDGRTLLQWARKHLPHSNRCMRTFEGHTGEVGSVCFSGDGQLALSGSYDKTLRLWDVSTSRCVRTLQAGVMVSSVSLSADGRWALSMSGDDTQKPQQRFLSLWELSSGRCVRTFEGGEEPCCFSDDGRWVLAQRDLCTLGLWEVSSGRCVRNFERHPGWVTSVTFSSNGRWALSGTRVGPGGSCDSKEPALCLWEVSSGRCLRTFTGHTDKVTSVSLSGDGRWALSGSDDKTLRLWEVSSGRCIRTFEGHTDRVNSVCLSRDGRWALSGAGVFIGNKESKVRMWEVASGRCLRTFEGHTGEVESVCFSGDGRWALSGSYDKTLRLWEVADITEPGPAILSKPQATSVLHSRQSAHEQALAETARYLQRGDFSAALRGLQKARSQPGYERSPQALDLLANLYQKLGRVTLKGGWLQRTLVGHEPAVHSVSGHKYGVTSASLSEDGRRALSVGLDETLRFWEVSSGRCVRSVQHYQEHTGWRVCSVCLSADGRWALSGSEDRKVYLWDVSSGRCVRTFEGHSRDVSSVCFSGDGRWALSGSKDRTLRLWEVATGRCLRTFEGHNASVDSVCMSADGRWAFSGSEDWKHFAPRLWEVSSGRCLRTFEGHSRGVTSVCLSADGRWALSGSEDHTLLLWEVASARCVRTFEGHTDRVNSVCLSADGRWALSGSGTRPRAELLRDDACIKENTLRLWEVSTGRCLRIFEGHTEGVTSVCLSRDGRWALSGSTDNTLRVWFLDWELEERPPADWDEGARPCLTTFLMAQTPYAGALPETGDLTDEQISRALTRQGSPQWTDDDFDRLLYTLGCAGYGWLRPEGVRKKLEEMAAHWQGLPPLSDLASWESPNELTAVSQTPISTSTATVGLPSSSQQGTPPVGMVFCPACGAVLSPPASTGAQNCIHCGWSSAAT